MVRLWVLVIIAVACKDESGTARKVSAPPASEQQAPEPPGGPPSCADVGAHLAAAVDMPREIHADVKGADFAVSGSDMRDGIEQGIANACRSGAWAHEARVCALGWKGNILSERAQLRDACPGTVK